MNAWRFFQSKLCVALFSAGASCALPAHASIVIAATRVIFPAQEREVTVKLSNESKDPRLAQIWLDNGDERAVPGSQEVPFTVTPPVARIDPGKAQTLRVTYTGEPLPGDRESVFWLNVLDIPPQLKNTDVNLSLLQIAVRSRIKLFFRPAGLPGNANAAPDRIQWRLVPGGIEAHNPTPYHVSFTRIETISGSRTATFDDGGMLPPGQTRTFALKGEIHGDAAAKLRYQTVNDYGGIQQHEMPLPRQ